MTRPSSLVTFWVLYPWMNPFRVGITRESGSVMFRTGPGPAFAAALGLGLRGPGPGLLHLGRGLPDPAVILHPGPAAPPRLPRRIPLLQRGQLRLPGRGHPGQVLLRQRHRRPGRPGPGPLPGLPPRPELRRLRPGLRLRRLALGLQLSQRLRDPLRPPPRRPPLLSRHLIAPPALANSSSSAASAAACAATACSASSRSRFSVRFAAFDADAAILVPSSATTPSRPIPSRAHSTSTCAKNPGTASPKSFRNRAIVQ